ncbi:MAG: glycosyltransferase family 39 protein [Planctomycetaceae bacterium]|nr:glycosyltransferase family 39 protein [Planctomycetaceae bacterium]
MRRHRNSFKEEAMNWDPTSQRHSDDPPAKRPRSIGNARTSPLPENGPLTSATPTECSPAESPWGDGVMQMDPTVPFFGWMLVFHVIGWTLLAAWTQPNVPSLTLELLTHPEGAAWGYVEHPPLAVWLAKFSTLITAPHVWPVYLLAQLCTAISMTCVWLLARRFLHPWTAVCASLVLAACYLLTISASSLTPSHVAGACWSVTILSFHTALTNTKRRYWMATGLFLGLGFLASYATALLLLAMFIFTVLDERARRCWDSSWPFLAALVMGLVVFPHAIWLWANDFVTVGYSFPISSSGADHFVHPIKFILLQMVAIFPLLLVLSPLVNWFNLDETMGSSEDDREFVRRFLLWVTCLPPAVLVAASVVSGSSSGVFEGVSFWAFAGLAWLLWGHLAEERLNWRKVLVRTGTVAGAMAAILFVINVMMPSVNLQASSVHFPGKQLAQQVQTVWANAGYEKSPPVIVGPGQLVRNASWYSRSLMKPAPLPDSVNQQIQQTRDETIRQVGGIVLWEETDEGDTEASLLSRFSTVEFVSPVELKWQTPATLEPIRIGMAIIHPESLSTAAGDSSALPTDTSPTETALSGEIVPTNYFGDQSAGQAVSPAGYSTTTTAQQPVAENPFMQYSGSTIPVTARSPQSPEPAASTGNWESFAPPIESTPADPFAMPKANPESPPPANGAEDAVLPLFN